MRKSRIALAALVLAIAACGGSTELAGFVRTPLPDVSAVALPDVGADGRDLPMRAAGDALLLVYFGYTSCPDVCPTTMADVAATLEDLGDDAARVDVAMATVDPNRDTDEVITGYVRSFVPDAHALRTTDDALLRRVADAFGAAYDVSVTEDEYDVIHTGHLYVVDDEGKLRVTWPFGVERSDMLNDLRILLGET